jgi:hypothetical protein
MLAAGRTGCGLAGLAFFVLAAATITHPNVTPQDIVPALAAVAVALKRRPGSSARVTFFSSSRTAARPAVT